jgi:GSH-dependent disulfide-bond oxidoreductase
MIELYYWPTPNGHKITMFLEEAGLGHRIHPVDISARRPVQAQVPGVFAEQQDARYHRSQPSRRRRADKRVRIRRHSYLSGRKDEALPAGRRSRPQDGDGVAILANGRARPMAGQNHHFGICAPEKIPYAINQSRLYSPAGAFGRIPRTRSAEALQRGLTAQAPAQPAPALH